MVGLSLCNVDVMGHLAVNATGIPPQEASVQTFHLAKIGDRVSFIDDSIKVPELTDNERTDTYVVKAVVDANDQQFVRLETVDGGKEFGWFAVDQLAPAAAPDKAKQPPAAMEPIVPTTPEEAAALATRTKNVWLATPPKKEKDEETVALTGTEANHRLLALGSDRAKAKGISLSAAIKELSSDEVASLVAIRDGHAPVAGSIGHADLVARAAGHDVL